MPHLSKDTLERLEELKKQLKVAKDYDEVIKELFNMAEPYLK